MDPIANLKEQLELAREIGELYEDLDTTVSPEAAREDIAHKAARLSELVLALDEWQRKGGFSPYTKR